MLLLAQNEESYALTSGARQTVLRQNLVLPRASSVVYLPSPFQPTTMQQVQNCRTRGVQRIGRLMLITKDARRRAKSSGCTFD